MAMSIVPKTLCQLSMAITIPQKLSIPMVVNTIAHVWHEVSQSKALDRQLILRTVGVEQFDNFLDCAKNSDAQVCAGVPLVVK